MVSTIGSRKAKKIKAGNGKSKTGRRNALMLAHKYEVIKTAERERKLGVRKLSEMFSCGKTEQRFVRKGKRTANLKNFLIMKRYINLRNKVKH